MVDEDPPHQAGGHREEMGAVLPLDTGEVDEPKVGLVHERRRLESMTPALPTHRPPGEPAKLAVNQGHQLLERRIVTPPQATSRSVT